MQRKQRGTRQPHVLPSYMYVLVGETAHQGKDITSEGSRLDRAVGSGPRVQVTRVWALERDLGCRL